MKRFFILAIAFLVSINLFARIKVIGYLPKYTNSYADNINAFDFTKLTHLNVAFFNPDVNGNFPSSQGTGLDQIVTKAHLNNVKVLISLAGGSNQSQYANLLLNANRPAFVTKVVALVSQYNVDGIDVDIEGDNIDSNYEAFVTDLAAALHPSNKLLTAALAYYTRTKITDNALAAFDFVNLMAYDQAGAMHSPYSFALTSINYWKNTRGLSADKITLGVPFYGYYTVGGVLTAMKYKDIIGQYAGAENRDTTLRSDGYVVNYNGITTIQNKTALAMNEAGGIMIWQLLQDTSGGTKSLLSAITKQLNDSVSTHGTWTGAAETIFWNYDLGANIGNLGTTYAASTVTKASVSTSSAAGFLSYAPTGNVRVGLPTTSIGGGQYSLPGLAIATTSSYGNTPNKFSAYGIANASAITSLFFTMSFTGNTANNGLIILGIGNSAGTVYSSTNQLTGTAQAGLFAGIQFTVGSSALTPSYRYLNGATYSYSALTPTISKYATSDVEIYCNNSAADQQYTRGTITYTLPSKKYNIFVNGVMLTSASSGNIPATGENTDGSSLDAFVFNSSNNTLPSNNSLIYALSNIKIGRLVTQNLLPISMNSFSAKAQADAVQLNWSTASESNNSHFGIYRSSAVNENFQLIGQINGSGNSSQLNNYLFNDTKPMAGVNFYKLQQVDYDGKYSSSPTIAVKIADTLGGFKAYFSGANQLQVIIFSEKNTEGEVRILDIAGRVLSKNKMLINVGINQKLLNLEPIPAGVYVVTLSTVDGIQSTKFVKN